MKRSPSPRPSPPGRGRIVPAVGKLPRFRDSSQRGSEIFRQLRLKCHGRNGEGVKGKVRRRAPLGLVDRES